MSLPNGQRVKLSIHCQRANVILEFEPSKGPSNPTLIVREMMGRIKDIDDVDTLVKRSTRLIKAVLGYDRVMMYRFDDDGSGKVVSEAKQLHLESFLGQYFPASDIPQQARKLYMQNPIRIISDARGDRVHLVPELDGSGEPLDLSFAHLRSCFAHPSGIFAQYGRWRVHVDFHHAEW